MDARKHKAGAYDTEMRTAMLDFQQKHAVMDQADIKRRRWRRSRGQPLDNDFAALRACSPNARCRRAASSRTAASASSVSDPAYPTYLGADGARHRVPDLATASREATLNALGIATPEDAVAFFRRHPRDDFAWLKVAVAAAAAARVLRPRRWTCRSRSIAATSGTTSRSTPAGARQPQPRERFPQLTLFVKWRGERVPLVRWRTTVGGWRAELASDGQEYYRYKGSDVGPRVWRHIVAAPVWIPPPSSPLGVDGEREARQRHLRARHQLRRDRARVPVGLRAGRRHPRGDAQRAGRRALLRQRHPHARLVRLPVAARALLARLPPPLQPAGDAPLQLRARAPALARRRARSPLGFRRAFYSHGEVFEMRLPTRGYYRELDPPMPVDVLEGRIKGTLQNRSPATSRSRASHTRRDASRRRRHARQPGRRGRAMTPRDGAIGPALAALGGGSPGCCRRGRRRRRGSDAARAARPAAVAAPAPRPPPLSDEAPEPAAGVAPTAGPGHDQAARRAAAPGARLLGAQGSRRRAAGDSSARAAARRWT